MESKTKNRKTRQQIEKMVARTFGNITLASDEDAIQELKDGWFNAAYILRLSDAKQVVLKIAPPQHAEVMTYEKNLMTTEVESMRLVAQNPNIPVPKIYYFDTAKDLCDSDYFFMEKVDGDNLEHIYATLPTEMKAQIDQQIGHIIREVNQFIGSYFGYDGNPDLRGQSWRETFIKIMDSMLEDGIRKNTDYCGFSIDDIRATIQKHASALDEVTTPRLCHWDAWNPNIFVKDGRVTGVIDFERALWGDPLIEAQFRMVGSESLKGYGKTTFTHTEDQRCQLYNLHLGILMKTECDYRHYETDHISNVSKAFILPAMRWLMEN